MAADGQQNGLIAVHVANVDPTTLNESLRGADDGPVRQRPDGMRSRFADSGIDWNKHGLDPRWLNMESSDCAAAIDPSIFPTSGAKELERFLSGADSRAEIALIVATIGDADDDRMPSIFAGADTSIPLPGFGGSIGGRRLPAKTRLSLAPGVNGADKDLGLRLLNRSGDAPWWSLSVSATESHSPYYGTVECHEPAGQLVPIVVDALGDPVVAAWVPDSKDQRWYVIPDALDPDLILDWLVAQAFPEYVPGALRRARSPRAFIPTLQTPHEEAARRALAELDASYEQERERLQGELHQASARAEPIRHGLLYGTKAELVEAVASVLGDAGLDSVDVDELLGDTSSADLLVSSGSERRLLEVKSAGGSAAEKLVGALERHLQTWPELRPEDPIGGGVLVVNHQHRLDPDARTEPVYSRPEFVASLTVPVISSRQLFEWWRASDWDAIRGAVMGQSSRAETSSPAPVPPAVKEAPAEEVHAGRRRLWRRRDQRSSG